MQYDVKHYHYISTKWSMRVFIDGAIERATKNKQPETILIIVQLPNEPNYLKFTELTITNVKNEWLVSVECSESGETIGEFKANAEDTLKEVQNILEFQLELFKVE
jgi:hypothetical protein